MTDEIKAELKAIETLLETLTPLTPHVRDSVIEYVFKRLQISNPGKVERVPEMPIAPPLAAITQPKHSPHPTDILSLKEAKEPKSGVEMVVVMAFYLAHCAPEGEARDYISSEDIKKYFLQAQFELPKAPAQTLVNAKNAGYLDPIEKGQYRLNSVGHNLVNHKMPSENGNRRTVGSPRRASPKRIVKKSAKKAKT